MHRQELLSLLQNHRTHFMEEAAYVRRARSFVEAHPDCFERSLLPAHVTGSAWVVNPDRSCALLLHHRKLNQWFQPGGHADGETDILGVALRESAEETGVDPAHIHLIDSRIFDVDIHSVSLPTQPLHEHIDIRFLLEIDSDIDAPGNHESNEVRWVPLHAVTRFNNNRSTYRMVKKTRRLRNAGAAEAAPSRKRKALMR